MWSQQYLELTSSLSRHLSCVAKSKWAKELELTAICGHALHMLISTVGEVKLSAACPGLCHSDPGLASEKGPDAKLRHNSARVARCPVAQLHAHSGFKSQAIHPGGGQARFTLALVCAPDWIR